VFLSQLWLHLHPAHFICEGEKEKERDGEEEEEGRMATQTSEMQELFGE